ncbi:hypothetical protein BJ878DRAFT_165418 [Calycina marina]|uniref:Uncharacterized protein n=1 Tax=Calycina marina TaxID=1763456 RepID=A0A9P7Z927_9HELO|nr:hypothetical protein BJ878DRAFT_165418 [Calycina marina]
MDFVSRDNFFSRIQTMSSLPYRGADASPAAIPAQQEGNISDEINDVPAPPYSLNPPPRGHYAWVEPVLRLYDPHGMCCCIVPTDLYALKDDPQVMNYYSGELHSVPRIHHRVKVVELSKLDFSCEELSSILVKGVCKTSSAAGGRRAVAVELQTILVLWNGGPTWSDFHGESAAQVGSLLKKMATRNWTDKLQLVFRYQYALQ